VKANALPKAVGELGAEIKSGAGLEAEPKADVRLHLRRAKAAVPLSEYPTVVDEQGGIEPHPNRPAVLGRADDRRQIPEALVREAAQIVWAAEDRKLREGNGCRADRRHERGRAAHDEHVFSGPEGRERRRLGMKSEVAGIIAADAMA